MSIYISFITRDGRVAIYQAYGVRWRKSRNRGKRRASACQSGCPSKHPKPRSDADPPLFGLSDILAEQDCRLTLHSFSVEQLEEILKDARVKPVVNQIQFHPAVLSQSQALLDFHKAHNIVTEGYSPNRPLTDGSSPGLVKVVSRIAEERGIQPDQVLLAWSRAKG